MWANCAVINLVDAHQSEVKTPTALSADGQLENKDHSALIGGIVMCVVGSTMLVGALLYTRGSATKTWFSIGNSMDSTPAAIASL